jgi:hypothetical protein
VHLRFSPDGEVDQRASSHHGYNYAGGMRNWGSDAGLVSHDGWGAGTGVLFVSGGSHAGSVIGFGEIDRFTPGRRVRLIPLESIAAETSTRFAVSPPWLKHVWWDPESDRTD